MIEPRPPVPGATPILPLPSGAEASAHPPLEGCDPVEVTEQAYGKRTFQSSAVADRYSGWMFATEDEDEPWWEIDLGEQMLLERVTLWLAPIERAESVEVTVAAHALHLPGGRVPPQCFHFRARANELPVASEGSSVVHLAPDVVARHVRVTLHDLGGAPVSLLVRGAQIKAAPIFADSLLESYRRSFTLFADRPLFSSREAPGEGLFLVTHRHRDVWMAARALAAALAEEIGPEGAGERVFLGLCTRNRPEWVMTDIACLLLGHVVVPLSPDDSDERLAGILGKCPLRAVLVDGGGAERFARLAAGCPSLQWIVSCDTPAEPSDPLLPLAAERNGGVGVRAFADLVRRGETMDRSGLDGGARAPKDLYTLLFTSGSTGVPKGAMRSYATFLAMLRSYFIAQPAVHLSFQPLSHLTERLYQPAVILHGGLIGFSAGGAHLLSDLAALQPSVLGTVPRLYEVVHTAYLRRLEAALAASPGEPRAEVEARVLAESREVFGARIQAVSTGSAPCPPEVLAFLRRCFSDLWVGDGYGSTECGTIASDGRIQPHVEVKLVPVAGVSEGERERGEIWVRTPHVIDGYYGDAEATAASLDAEGFWATGDLGERTADGGVRVVGRVKNVVKLGQGEFVAIDRIEAELAGCPLVDQIFVHPDGTSSRLMAVVVPQRDALGRSLGAAEGSIQALCAHPDAAGVIARGLVEHGRRAGLASFEVPAAGLVEPAPFTVESGLLTPSGKVARPALIARYAARLAELGRAAPALDVSATGSLAEQIAASASRVVGRRVEVTDSLHDGLGMDSLAAAEVLSAASAAVGREISLGLWLSARSAEELARKLSAGMLGRQAEDLRERDIDLCPAPSGDAAPARAPFETVLLTGATGLLGAHLFEELIARASVHIVCLVRAASDGEAAARVRRTLARYGMAEPDPARWSAIAADLAAPGLGLAKERYDDLAARADSVLHAAAEVNWIAPYEGLRAANVLGTVALIKLSMTRKIKPFHFISTISTAEGDEASILPWARARTGGGYGLSKWVAEKIVRRAAERGHPAAVYRPAMITGHSVRGIGNADDYVHRYLRACVESGRYLASDERLDMTPVDHVAGGIVALLLSRPGGSETYHLTNLERSMTYRELGRAMGRAGVRCEPVRYADFREVASAPGSPLRPLLSYFPEGGFALKMGPWPSARTRAALLELGVVCPPVDDALVARYVEGLSLP